MRHLVRTEAAPGRMMFRVLAVATLTFYVAYLVWRVSAGTIDPRFPLLTRLFFGGECLAFLSTAMFIMVLWSGIRRFPTMLRDASPPVPASQIPSVDIMIPTLNEP